MKRKLQARRADALITAAHRGNGNYHEMVRNYAMSRILSCGSWLAWRQGRYELSLMLRHRFCGWRYYGRIDFQLLRRDIRREQEMLELQLSKGMAGVLHLKQKVYKEMQAYQELFGGMMRKEKQFLNQIAERGMPIYESVFESDVDWYMQTRRRPKNRYKFEWYDKRLGSRWKLDYDDTVYHRVEQFLYQRHKRLREQLHRNKPWLYE